MSLDRRMIAAEHWHEELRRLRDSGFAYLDVLGAAESPDGSIEIYAHLVRLSTPDSPLERVLAITALSAEAPAVDSVRDVFAGAAWHEREIAEMFGVHVPGGDPRPMLVPSGSHPLRKAAVLTARTDRPWPGHEDGSRRRPLGVGEDRA